MQHGVGGFGESVWGGAFEEQGVGLGLGLRVRGEHLTLTTNPKRYPLTLFEDESFALTHDARGEHMRMLWPY